MFTGIVEEVGRILAIERGAKSCRLQIGGERIFADLQLGDSVAVNGVCLTVAALSSHGFWADVMAETLRRSALGALQTGSLVNLERALAAQGRFGGHIISGHIDGVGRIQQISREDQAVWLKIETPPSLLRYVVEKGSIAIDGVSLTVAKVDEESFSVSIIPHTGKATILLQKQVGDAVNLENDIIAKYVEKLLQPTQQTTAKGGITREFLLQHGF